MEAPQVQIDTSMGSFTVELYYKHAPRTVKNFLELSRRGYYDGVKVRLRYLQASIRGPAQHSRSADESNTWGWQQLGQQRDVVVEAAAVQTNSRCLAL